MINRSSRKIVSFHFPMTKDSEFEIFRLRRCLKALMINFKGLLAYEFLTPAFLHPPACVLIMVGSYL